jgi:hypothetical protein
MSQLKAEIRQMEDRLGLSPLALLPLRCEVSAAEPAPAPASRIRRFAGRGNRSSRY